MRFAALGLALAFLGGCATTPVKVEGDSYCRIAKRITWSKNDTSPTISQIRRHNAARRSVCG